MGVEYGVYDRDSKEYAWLGKRFWTGDRPEELEPGWTKVDDWCDDGE